MGNVQSGKPISHILLCNYIRLLLRRRAPAFLLSVLSREGSSSSVVAALRCGARSRLRCWEVSAPGCSSVTHLHHLLRSSAAREDRCSRCCSTCSAGGRHSCFIQASHETSHWEQCLQSQRGHRSVPTAHSLNVKTGGVSTAQLEPQIQHFKSFFFVQLVGLDAGKWKSSLYCVEWCIY